MNSSVKRYKTVLTIAGSDCSGGAGIQADIKAISANGAYAMSAITAVTSQNTTGVRAIHLIPAETVAAQINAIAEDIPVDAVKLGMLPTAEIVSAVAELLRRYAIRNIVLDPVMVATSGDRLIEQEAVEAIKTEIFPIADLITPNIPETEFISGRAAGSETDFPAAAEAMLDLGAEGVLIKAGHLPGERLTDHLYHRKGDRIEQHAYTYERIDTPNTHGTGCTLSSSIAAFLALGHPLSEAVGLAEDYLHKAILTGAEYKTGQGHGPVHHFFRVWE